MMNFGYFNPNIQNQNHITISSSQFFNGFSKSPFSSISSNIQNQNRSIQLNANISPLKGLKFYALMPKNFTITTNGGSGIFNIDILTDASQVINDFHKNNPNHFQYHLDINDEENVLEKFEQLYQGKTVHFKETDIPTYKNITEMLKITRCPNYKTSSTPNQFPNFFSFNQGFDNIASGAKMNENSFENYLKNEAPKSFTISTRKNNYNCTNFGILSSSVLYDLITKDPTLNKYDYDFEDEFNEFQIICDFFNFKPILVTPDNANMLKDIADDLQIELIIKLVDKVIADINAVSDKIDEQQSISDSIDELFEWLHNIKKLTVESVINSIIRSNWIKTEESIQELAAFILQTIKTDFLLHPYLIDLLEGLDNKADEFNHLKLLIPFIANHLLNSIGQSKAICSFIYILFKRGHILLNDIINIFKKPEFFSSITSNENINSWFLPELIDNHIFNENALLNSSQFSSFIKLFYPNKIDLYKQMRDSGEPDNELTKAFRYDDVDKVQSILSRNVNDISKSTIPYNIYEDFIPNGTTKYINYAAACGSIKCFKYLLLNHQQIDESTFRFAVFGGNIEIIKIVDQTPVNQTVNNANMSSKIIPSIRKHDNKVFDWILENKFNQKDKSESLLQELITNSAENGNVHALIGAIDSGFSINDNKSSVKNAIQLASQNGFYKFSQFLYNILERKNQTNKSNQNEATTGNASFNIPLFFGTNNSANIEFFVQFGNLDIYKLGKSVCANVTSTDIERALSVAVKKKYMSIIKYIFEQEILSKKFLISSNGITNALSNSLLTKSCELFDFLMEQFKIAAPSVFNEYKNYSSILPVACSNDNFEATKKIIDIIQKQNTKNDLTNSFIRAASTGSLDICKYFVEKKIPLNFELIINSAFDLGLLNKELFSLIADNAPPNSKYKFYVCSLNPAIRKRNKELVDFLLSQKITYDTILIDAVFTHSVEIVDTVLKYENSPSFINRRTENGSALQIATRNNDISIVQRLLSLPEIDVNSCDQRNSRIINHIIENNKKEMLLLYLKTEKVDTNVYNYNNGNSLLMFAIENNNIEIAKLLINYPKTNINAQNYQGQTALTFATTRKLEEIISLLICSDRFDPVESRLNHAFYMSTGQISKLLASCKSLDVCSLNIPRSNNNINSLFMMQNDQNEYYYTSLMSAADKNNFDKIDIIINHPSFDINKSGLDQAINNSIRRDNVEIFKKLIGLAIIDINDFKFKNSSLIKCVLDSRSEKILNEILDYPNFKISEKDLQDAFIKIYFFNKVDIYELLSKLCNYAKNHKHVIDFKKCLPNGKSYFTSIVRPYNLDIEKVVNLLLDNGADPNAPDDFLVYPLEYAISLNNYEFVVALLNSNRIDYTQKITTLKFLKSNPINFDNANDFSNSTVSSNNTNSNDSENTNSSLNTETPKFKTYLHLAAVAFNSILTEFLNRKLIDINIEDDQGNTPLLDACMVKQRENIEILLANDDIDYLHKNKNGVDALKLLRDSKAVLGGTPSKDNEEEIKDKDKYCEKLLSLLKQNTLTFDTSKNNDVKKPSFNFNFKDNSNTTTPLPKFNFTINFNSNNNQDSNKEKDNEAKKDGEKDNEAKKDGEKDNEAKKDGEKDNEAKKDGEKDNEAKKDSEINAESKKDEKHNEAEKDSEKEAEITKTNWKDIRNEVENAVLGIFADATPQEIHMLKKSLSAIAERNENGIKIDDDDDEKYCDTNENYHEQKQGKDDEFERDYAFYADDYDDRTDVEYTISPYEIQQNNAIQQQWQNILQFDFIRQSNFEKQMRLQAEFLQSLQSQPKKRKKKRKSHK